MTTCEFPHNSFTYFSNSAVTAVKTHRRNTCPKSTHFPLTNLLSFRTLSSTTLDALKSFYAERDARAEQFAKLQVQAEALHDAQTGDDEGAAAAVKEPEVLSMEAFGEDWNESQFWVCMHFFFCFVVE